MQHASSDSIPNHRGRRPRRSLAAALLLLLGSACSVPIDTGLGARREPASPAPPATVADAAEAGRRAYESGNPDDGERLVRRAEQASDASPDDKPRLASTLTEIALQQSRRGNNEEAIELHERALRLRQEAYGEADPEVAESLTFLGAAYYQAQRYGEAENAFSRAVAIRRRLLGAEHRLTGQSINNLAFFYAGVGDYERADPLFVESIRIIEAAADASWSEKARALDNYAAMLLDAGRPEDAADVERRSADYRSKRKQIEDVIELTR